MPQTLYREVHSAILGYLRHIDAGGERVRLPKHKHDPARSANRVHASSIGYCPRARAAQRLRVPMVNPPTEAEELVSRMRMEDGVSAGELIQAAMIWKYGRARLYRGWLAKNVQTGAAAEVSVDSESLKVRGRIDVWLRIDGVDHLIEVKRRDPWKGGGNIPLPKIGDALQLLSYGVITGVESLSILTRTRVLFKLWSLRPVGNGYMIFDEKGEAWNDPLNRPEIINVDRMKAEIARHLDYIEGRTFDRPFEDFLNDERSEGWYCWKWNSEPAKKYSESYAKRKDVQSPGRNGFIVPKCEWWCHQPIPESGELRYEVEETGYQSNQYQIVGAA